MLLLRRVWQGRCAATGFALLLPRALLPSEPLRPPACLPTAALLRPFQPTSLTQLPVLCQLLRTAFAHAFASSPCQSSC